MSSKERATRELQKDYYQTAILSRLSLLREKGLEDVVAQKDRHLKQLRAELRRTNSRLSRISQIEKQNEALALRKQEAAETNQAVPSQEPEKG